MTEKSAETDDRIVRRLRALWREAPDLKEPARVYEILLPLLRDADLRVAPVSITPGEARAKMEKGLPLLHDIDLELDVNSVCKLMIHIARAMEGAAPPGHRSSPEQSSNEPGTAAARIRLALEKRDLDLGVLLPHIAAGERGPITAAALGLQLDPGLVWTLAANALKPALRAWHRQLAPLVEGIPWHKVYCYMCGAPATLGELQGNNLAKHLRCGECGSDWRFPRLQCTSCGNEDHATQRYLYAEDHRETMRLEVCDKCRGYLKVITAFTPTLPEMLPVEDLATLHLDFIAQGHGYARGEGLHAPDDKRARGRNQGTEKKASPKGRLG